MKKNRDQEYQGFEQGPIRPPSEANSLLIRISRNCPWNHCTFCPVYKGTTFSLRPVEHIIKDIDRVRDFLSRIEDNITLRGIQRLAQGLNQGDRMALSAALNWTRSGKRAIFLQDANSLIIKPDDLLTVLHYLQDCFPWVERVTSYARSQTICRIPQDKLANMRQAGLNRIHIGMESGSDKVLAMVKKGSSKTEHIEAGKKVKEAHMELSEYVIPGLGGRELSYEHALETADALNQINCNFIRLRTLTIPNHVPLAEQADKGIFCKLSDKETACEILLFLQHLEGIHSSITSDHILNLFEEIQGTFPNDKERMISVIKSFFALSPEEQALYQVGRRTGIFRTLADLQNPGKRNRAQENCNFYHITPENVEQIMAQLTQGFV